MKTHESFERSAPQPPSERSFAWVFTAFFAALALWPLWRGRPARWWALAAAVLVLLAGLIRPSVLRFPNLHLVPLGTAAEPHRQPRRGVLAVLRHLHTVRADSSHGRKRLTAFAPRSASPHLLDRPQPSRANAGKYGRSVLRLRGERQRAALQRHPTARPRTYV